MISIYPVFKEGRGNKAFFNILESKTGFKFLPFTCGRSAMVAGLSAAGLGRMDEILVPPYVGQCVLSALSRTSFPTMTPSIRTKAILAFHQFGFPQNLTVIESEARSRGWTILNDCANTLFTKINEQYLIEWGDFTIISLSKLYPCGLGGGFYSRQQEIHEKVFSGHKEVSCARRTIADQALKKLIEINRGSYETETIIELNSLYGYLPDLIAFPETAYSGLPSSMNDVDKDINHRKKLYNLALNMFENNVPFCDGEVVPFAIPISGKKEQLLSLSEKIQGRFGACAPVLHFDYARNILKPDYRPALVIGCHDEWNDDIVHRVFELIKKEL
ncbi:MAG: hypothetical protein A2W05_09715 [Candidatus Schekmanbacteria bacterium RBG_16_38_10]|uniref:DegT/DnrJ/EryC1/StrS aminotransferase n=1 Tax=Candidatus Schekmanbacteria bacterium RBG_16_38_10 TaxID=1817879 RepID=A0A1F7RX60_9BACT|nr:MAG: hypothetical protein A2W05_09715 [Candidatus Schekmanbacteria bacterium RBG_16_38_10]